MCLELLARLYHCTLIIISTISPIVTLVCKVLNRSIVLDFFQENVARDAKWLVHRIWNVPWRYSCGSQLTKGLIYKNEHFFPHKDASTYINCKLLAIQCRFTCFLIIIQHCMNCYSNPCSFS
jgi:hypothetical protein